MVRHIVIIIFAVLYCSVSTKPLYAKGNNSFITEIKDHIQSNNEFNGNFKHVTNQYGNPVWSQAFEKKFGQYNVAVTPLINYANDYTSGIVVFMADESGSLKHEFISRETLLKLYTNKKKSQKMKYKNNIIASFLKFDLKLYNVIERKLTQSIGFNKGSEEMEIKSFKIDESILTLFN